MAMHFKKQEKTEAERKKSTERRGFYLALAVCLTAIGIAAWSTYDTVSGFLEPTGSESSASSAASTPRPTPETSVPVDDDPESAVSAGHAQGTVPEGLRKHRSGTAESERSCRRNARRRDRCRAYVYGQRNVHPTGAGGGHDGVFRYAGILRNDARLPRTRGHGLHRGARRNRARLRKRNRKRDAYGHAAWEYDCDRARRLRSALLRTR